MKQIDIYAIDLFAGGGGLTVGLKRAGFKVIGAIEIEKHAYSTYKVNHPEVTAYRQDIRKIKGTDFLALSPTNEIHLVAGCPPCQGFTSLTAKYTNEDPRNELIREMTRLVNEIRPTAVMMENVPGLAHRGRYLLDEFVAEIESMGYIVRSQILNLLNYGVPQYRKRLVLLAGKGFEITHPPPSHSKKGEEGLTRWRTVRDTIFGLPNPVVLKDTLKSGGPQNFDWHVIRAISETNKNRLQALLPGETRAALPRWLRPKCHKGIDTGFSNVYSRMRWDEPAPTITAGCTTPSKGRFGHPFRDGTISVREAALLQTFPADYVIDTPYMTYACDIVGNALPCDFAAAISSRCYEAIIEHLRNVE